MNKPKIDKLKILMTLLVLFCLSQTLWAIPLQETYKSHTVQKGETVYSISQKYGVSEEAIYQLNPDARQGISTNSILIIPASQNQLVVTGFKTHKTKRKETLFSISQKYGVSIDDIKKHNKFLYSRGLKKGDKLQIPKLEKVAVSNENTSETTNGDAVMTQIHEVQPKETFYGIARKYGISIAELKALNPDLNEQLPIGTKIKVPLASVTESALIEEDRFDFYEVQPKEGFYRLKVKLGLTQEEIIALNPYAKEGLKEGMILKIPREVSEGLVLEANKVDLEKTISNTATKRIALMLPFQLKEIEKDSLDQNESILKHNRTLRIALDFYSGVLLATEFAKDKGVSVNLQVFDTEGNSNKVKSILATHDFSSIDAVIGPLLSKNVTIVASELRSDNIPVVSPLSNRDIKLTSNLFQTLPNDVLLKDAMIQYLKEHHLGKNVLLISDASSTTKAEILEAIPTAKTLSPREKGFLYVTDIQAKMEKGVENWVILESKSPIILSNVIGLLNGLPDDLKIRLFTTDKNDSYDFDDISNMQLSHLQFTFPSVSKSYDFDEKHAFLVSYKNKYGVYPNKYAVRGFDITYDVLLRLANATSLYDAVDNDTETEYVENKFRYDKKLFSGYTNKAFYILRYTDTLQFEVLR
ncbi:MAG TPA: LysM peptidoglycan-binding domain-containing protein [Flavobacteriaceae bacterium]|nr:LysM peptidoglycan-binding domain-containing protein [Flavobacteriaceae bacterium]MCB9212369.1 LysM peptidoglycan-binding domain-containing protein [Alteromonas sp.]HPF11645.1 LysM peptidoglycan-binding domain-containing protein [Flavobacteriaceae bacterium]HQU20120.1 LysM peptidoglycan-binding domain-containing protein [Flavobacteriaceae bacterium]HQU64791.1 LysM peptidoglycan-binding domain-containing protein [Flavobacteriaceae bacterium]